MKWFKNMKLAKKLLLGFISVAVLAGVIGGIGYTSIGSSQEGGQLLYYKVAIPSAQIGQIAEDFQKLRVTVRDLVLAQSDEERQQYAANMSLLGADIQSTAVEYEKSLLTEAGKREFGEFKAAHEDVMKQLGELRDMALAGRKKEAVIFMRGGIAQAASRETRAIDSLDNMKQAVGKQNVADQLQDGNTAKMWMLVITGIGIVVAILLGLSISRMISKPVQALAAKAATVAQGDLRVEITSDSLDEIGQLAEAFKGMIENLRTTIGQVGEASAAVASSSSEISSSTEEMAAGAQEQSTQAGEVASAVEEMTKTIVENSKTASTTADTAKKAKDIAEEGSRAMDETVSGMRKIGDATRQTAATIAALGKSSAQIGEIIGVIDDIADQTNLLALNAAIEAARAGDQGRGFAVVADEVRKLAERTTKATKEIASMIKSIQADTHEAGEAMNDGNRAVEEGITLADKAGASLKEIVQMIQSLTDMVTQIAAAGEEQSSASEQIAKNVEAISSVTNESAAGTQQIARAADDLNRLTEVLQDQVSKFILSNQASGAIDRSHETKSLPTKSAHNAPVSIAAAVRESSAIVDNA
jgi:methyl-accepting chemotaxis protein